MIALAAYLADENEMEKLWLPVEVFQRFCMTDKC